MVILWFLLLAFPAYADWLEVSVDKPEVFVQEQVIYTLKLYREPSLHRGYFNDFEKSDFLSEILEDSSPEETWLNGKKYFISQRKIALFPQKSGNLIIPASSYSGRDVFVKGNDLEIKVKPAFAQGWWLPAKGLEIKSELNLPDTIRTGDIGELTIEITANSLSAEQLPKTDLRLPTGIKSHLSKIIIDNHKSPEGIVGKRKEIHLLNFKKAGEFNWLGLEINWWNLEEKRYAKATTKAMTFNIVPMREIIIEENNITIENNQHKQELYLIIFMLLSIISVIIYAIYKGFHYNYDLAYFIKAAKGQDALKAWKTWHKLGLDASKLPQEAQAELEKIRQSAFGAKFVPWDYRLLVENIKTHKSNKTDQKANLPQLNPQTFPLNEG